jgi:hypothetical protein
MFQLVPHVFIYCNIPDVPSHHMFIICSSYVHHMFIICLSYVHHMFIICSSCSSSVRYLMFAIFFLFSSFSSSNLHVFHVQYLPSSLLCSIPIQYMYCSTMYPHRVVSPLIYQCDFMHITPFLAAMFLCINQRDYTVERALLTEN